MAGTRSTRDSNKTRERRKATGKQGLDVPRPAQPAELAPAYVFFASADSRYCTGEVLAITGSVTTR